MTFNVSAIVRSLMLAYALSTIMSVEFVLAFLVFSAVNFTFSVGRK